MHGYCGDAYDQVARDVSAVLPKRKLTGLIIDESGWVKKGDKSVGVGWQYLSEEPIRVELRQKDINYAFERQRCLNLSK